MRSALLVLHNVLKAWLLVVAFSALLGGLGWLLGGYRVMSLFVFCALLAAVAAYWYADRVVLGLVGARELPLAEAPALHSTLERLAARAGVMKPRLHVIPDSSPRILAAGRGPRSSAIAVSRGLLAITAPAELEGLLAHELAHVRNRDVLVQSAAAVVAATLVETSRLGGWLQRALVFVLAPVAAAFVHTLLSPKREFLADRAAAELCESPHGLADALLRLDQASEIIDFSASPATEPLYPIDPFADDGLAKLFSTHPPVAARVRRLRALDPDWPQKLRAA